MRLTVVRVAVAMGLLFLAAGCVPHQWDKAKLEPKRFSRRQQVKVWSADSVLRVVVTVR